MSERYTHLELGCLNEEMSKYRILKGDLVFSIPYYFNSFLVNLLRVKTELVQFSQLEINDRVLEKRIQDKGEEKSKILLFVRNRL